tara:strand:- start:2234 stop:3283 length:1050 start_codon:yes stop_codon:yes gene_type:complete
MTSFKPDLFSSPGPYWQKVNLNEQKNLSSNIFSFKANKIIKNIYKVKGLEINSSNLLIELKNEKIIVKKNPFISSKKFNYQIYLYEFLRKKRSPVPKLSSYQFERDILYRLSKDRVIYLEFQKGRYFNGSYEDLFKTAKSINLLNNATNSIDFSRIEKLPLFPKKSPYILKKFFSLLDKGLIKISSENKKALIKNELFLFETHKRIIDNLYLFKDIPEKALHTDLHPHNILINNSKSFILDIESIRRTKWPIALGFAIFKLLRQTLTKNRRKKDFKLHAKKFIEIIHDKDYSRIDLKILLFGAEVEVFRRLLFIFEGNLEGKVSAWNKVLIIQLNALREIKELKKILSD